MNSKVEIKAISTKNSSILVSQNGKENWFKVTDKVRQFMDKMTIGEAEMSVTTEVDEMGMPYISFIKNTGFTEKKQFGGFKKPSQPMATYQKEARDEKALTMLVSYAKDTRTTVMEMFKGKPIMPQEIEAMAREMVMRDFIYFKEKLQEPEKVNFEKGTLG